jgi:hypothetical protein
MITFHPGAQSSFTTAAEELLKDVKTYPVVAQRTGKGFDIHPKVVLQDKDIIGIPVVQEHSFDGIGQEVGRFWNYEGSRFGWVGENFRKIKLLAERFAKSKELLGLVSETFILDQIFDWLCKTLEGKQSDSITTFICARCNEAIKENEYYIPLCRTYSSVDFTIGDVEFKSISKQFLDGWFPSKPLDDPEMERRVRALENDTRAKFQAMLAACVKIRAEEKAASDQALDKALKATALLRFLSSANWTSKIRSFAMPFGMENSLGWHRFCLRNGAIVQLCSASIQQGPYEWVIDESRAQLVGVLESLSDLAKSQKTEFRANLYDAMLIYSRNSTTVDAADKLVFILVALEAMLLKDSSEPIQGNLGERMAFLVGGSLEERKKIVSAVKKTYAMRSKFIHHGQSIDDLEIFDTFLFYAWSSFLKMINLRDTFAGRLDLLAKLDEMKLS